MRAEIKLRWVRRVIESGLGGIGEVDGIALLAVGEGRWIVEEVSLKIQAVSIGDRSVGRAAAADVVCGAG